MLRTSYFTTGVLLMLALPLSAAAQTGKIVVTMDDWTHSDTGFAQAPTTAAFYENMAAWFTGGAPGTFLVPSSHQTFAGSAFYTTLQNAGHTVLRDVTTPPTLAYFQNFDAVFFCSGPAVDLNELIQYVNSGGNVYLAAGTSTIPSGVSNYWNPFLTAFGIELTPTLANSCNGVRAVDSAHPLFTGVDSLYYAGPQPILDSAPGNASARLVAFCGPFGSQAVFGDSVGSSVCTPAIPNSTGSSAYIQAAGSTSIGLGDFVLSASDMPANATGYFLTSRAYGGGTTPPGSQGRLCLVGNIGRFSGPGQVLNTGGGGSFGLAVDLQSVPTPTGLVPAMSGETWDFQGWFRDVNPGSTSNFTDVVEVTFL